MELVEKCRKQEWHVLGLPNKDGEEALLKNHSVSCTVPWESQWNAKKFFRTASEKTLMIRKDKLGECFLDTVQEQLICCWVAWVSGSGIDVNPGSITGDVPEKTLHKMHLTNFI